jgi:hypothetical protein
MSPVKTEPPRARVGKDRALVFTMRELNQQTAHVMGEIETTRKHAFITRHGRFIAVIEPLEPGQVESRVLAEMALEVSKRS